MKILAILATHILTSKMYFNGNIRKNDEYIM